MDFAHINTVDEIIETAQFILRNSDNDEDRDVLVNIGNPVYPAVSEMLVNDFYITYSNDIEIMWQRKGTQPQDEVWGEGENDTADVLMDVYTLVKSKNESLGQYSVDLLWRLDLLDKLEVGNDG